MLLRAKEESVNDKYIYPELPERPSFDNSANIKQPEKQ
jgi:hypothetical protein